MTAPQKKRVLIIEDEPDMVRGLTDALSFEGFDVIAAGSGKRGAELALSERPDIILLDLMLPDINGFQVCESIRRHDSRVPVIMLTARSQEADTIRGLEVGADDYVTKPFRLGELVARINAVVRRLERAGRIARQVHIGEALVDFDRQVALRGDKELPLSFYEAELCKLLYERLGEPVGRDEILDKIWGLEASPTNRTVDNFIVKLRRKIERDAANPEHILTVHGQGYKLVG